MLAQCTVHLGEGGAMGRVETCCSARWDSIELAHVVHRFMVGGECPFASLDNLHVVTSVDRVSFVNDLFPKIMCTSAEVYGADRKCGTAVAPIV